MSMVDSRRDDDADNGVLRLSADIVAAYVSNNRISGDDLPGLISATFQAFSALGGEVEDAAAPAPRGKPAVPVSRSIQPDHLVCLEDGKQLKMLKRYLRTQYGMSPEDYRRKWGLPHDYPMVAPAYAQRRSDFAKKIGLGKGVRKK